MNALDAPHPSLLFESQKLLAAAAPAAEPAADATQAPTAADGVDDGAGSWSMFWKQATLRADAEDAGGQHHRVGPHASAVESARIIHAASAAAALRATALIVVCWLQHDLVTLSRLWHKAL